MELSVVIASRNRSAMLRRCLEALAQQDAGAERFEVVVADDGSSDGTAAMLAEFQAPFRLRALELDQVGRGAARNAAIEVAEGRICLILDDDVIVSPQLIGAHLAAHGTERQVICVGHLEQRPPDAADWYAHAFAAAWEKHYDSLDRRGATWTDCYGGNLSVARDGLLQTGGFASPDLPIDDIDLAFRLQRLGYRPVFVPEARAVHDDQKPWRRLLRDSKLQGVAHVEMADREPETMPPLLGWFREATPREVALRRVLIALRLPAPLLAAAGRLLPGEGRRQIWFDFVSRFAFWRSVRAAMGRDRWLRTTRGVPILMYHAFSEGDEGDRFVVSKRSLRRQLRLLALLRYRVVSFGELVEELRSFELPPRRALAITIDDGYRDNVEVAMPLLRRHGFPATIFLVSKRLGAGNDWSDGDALAGRPMLSAEQACDLPAAAIEVGAHTRSHRALPELDDDSAGPEIQGSREDLEQLLGSPVRTFAYPYGRRDERSADLVRDSGFLGACTVVPKRAGPADDPMLVPRIEVRGSDSLRRFLTKLWFGGA